jgi:putative membrane protein
MVYFLVFHIVAFIIWMGALLDLTRILGYHVAEELSVQARLSRMEFRIFFFVATPGMVLTLLMGLGLFISGGGVEQYLTGGTQWFHAKLTLVLGLLGVHYFVGQKILALRAKPEKISPKAFKALHGIAALLLIGVVVLVKTKSF